MNIDNNLKDFEDIFKNKNIKSTKKTSFKKEVENFISTYSSMKNFLNVLVLEKEDNKKWNLLNDFFNEFDLFIENFSTNNNISENKMLELRHLFNSMNNILIQEIEITKIIYSLNGLKSENGILRLDLDKEKIRKLSQKTNILFDEIKLEELEKEKEEIISNLEKGETTEKEKLEQKLDVLLSKIDIIKDNIIQKQSFIQTMIQTKTFAKSMIVKKILSEPGLVNELINNKVQNNNLIENLERTIEILKDKSDRFTLISSSLNSNKEINDIVNNIKKMEKAKVEAPEEGGLSPSLGF